MTRAHIDRRQFLTFVGLGCATFCSERAEATLVRGLTLEALAKTSDRIVVGTALDSSSHWENIGGRSRIVTDTRVRVDSTISGPAAKSEVLVRTYGVFPSRSPSPWHRSPTAGAVSQGRSRGAGRFQSRGCSRSPSGWRAVGARPLR